MGWVDWVGRALGEGSAFLTRLAFGWMVMQKSKRIERQSSTLHSLSIRIFFFLFRPPGSTPRGPTPRFIPFDSLPFPSSSCTSTGTFQDADTTHRAPPPYTHILPAILSLSRSCYYDIIPSSHSPILVSWAPPPPPPSGPAAAPRPQRRGEGRPHPRPPQPASARSPGPGPGPQ